MYFCDGDIVSDMLTEHVVTGYVTAQPETCTPFCQSDTVIVSPATEFATVTFHVFDTIVNAGDELNAPLGGVPLPL